MSSKAAIVVPALRRHTSTVIVAHGLGDSGAGWAFLSEQWRRQNKFPETKFIFPNAPSIPITVSMGMSMPGWYDITDFGDLANRSEDETGILRSQAVFHDLIRAEVNAGIASERIVLGGFSQGAAMSLISGLTYPGKLGGVFALSGYLLLQKKFRDMIPADSPNQKTPIFIGHGDSDQVVKYVWGKATADQLKEWGWDVDFRTYKYLAHSADPDEIDDLEAYLKTQIPDQGDKGNL